MPDLCEKCGEKRALTDEPLCSKCHAHHLVNGPAWGAKIPYADPARSLIYGTSDFNRDDARPRTPPAPGSSV